MLYNVLTLAAAEKNKNMKKIKYIQISGTSTGNTAI